jgi:hypothetical protein
MGAQIVFYTSTHQQISKQNPAFFYLHIYNTLIQLVGDIPKYRFM